MGEMDNNLKVRQKVATKTTQEWELCETAPLEGEICYDSTVNQVKVGDGVHLFKDLTYISAPGDYLPLAGGTMTGPITMPANLTTTNNKYAVNLNNSDVINIRQLQFKAGGSFALLLEDNDEEEESTDPLIDTQLRKIFFIQPSINKGKFARDMWYWMGRSNARMFNIGYFGGVDDNLTSKYYFDYLYIGPKTVTNTGNIRIYADCHVTSPSTITSTGFIKTNGTASQFLKADGSVDSTDYLAKSGGTMTGQLILPANRYGDYDAALNLRNSNIEQVNSIYTADIANDMTKGLNFYRDSSHWDSLVIANGNILFKPNRAKGDYTSVTNSSVYTVYHSGNLPKITEDNLTLKEDGSYELVL